MKIQKKKIKTSTIKATRKKKEFYIFIISYHKYKMLHRFKNLKKKILTLIM